MKTSFFPKRFDLPFVPHQWLYLNYFGISPDPAGAFSCPAEGGISHGREVPGDHRFLWKRTCDLPKRKQAEASGHVTATAEFLPVAEKRLERLLERAGMLDAEEPHIKDWDSELSDELLGRMHVTRESIFELNRLCTVVEALDEAARKKLDAVAQCAEPEYAFQMRHLAENLELFDFVPGVQTADGYGRYLIQESGHYEYDENLEPYYD